MLSREPPSKFSVFRQRYRDRPDGAAGAAEPHRHPDGEGQEEQERDPGAARDKIQTGKVSIDQSEARVQVT